MPKDAGAFEAGVGPVDDALLETLVGVALAAGRAAVDMRPRAPKGASGSLAPPAFDAARARELVLKALAEIAPRTPVVTEGSPAADTDPGSEFFLVDPGDGAEEAAGGGDEVTIDIAIIQDGAPVAGVVYAPALERIWAARPGAAWRAEAPPDIGVDRSRPIRVRATPERVSAVAGDRDVELDSFLAAYRADVIRSGSASLKFCLIAEGAADLFPALAGSMAWSTAAGDAILRAAGGRTVTFDGEPLTYGPAAQPDQSRFAQPPFVALGSVNLKTPVPA